MVLTSAAAAEPIYLDADEAEIDNVSGVSVYTGNVVMTQGLREITGDRMTVHTTREGRELSRVIVEGRPAVYTQQPDDGTALVRADAPRMEYFATGPERIILMDGGRITRGRNEFTGEVIEYNLETEVVNARGDDDTGRRIRITLFPEDEE
ncbi:lipopolysaccharide transport periplasmic protein LptA [Natronocella acetinitrilica]|uniref:lipopolysaccharide transport periplasmic protein LptA n=1 Tax=Natronocella acetinitrilica TaxID=414046 RepID=UPI00209FD7AB|nr:lipopolysaccharide transport periplasmic protein LptA [Natronocella acetinitrilica]